MFDFVLWETGTSQKVGGLLLVDGPLQVIVSGKKKAGKTPIIISPPA